MEFKMNRNGSGAYDGVAYKALMGAPKSGEIWTYTNGNREKEVLVIKNHGTCCTVLTLLDESKNHHSIEITSRSLKYTDPRMMQYLFNDTIGQFVKALSGEEFDNVLDEVEEALGLNIYRVDAREELEAAKNKIKSLQAELEAERSKTVTSDPIYKRLYDELIDKLIDKKVM